MKLRPVKHHESSLTIGWSFYCPGCGHGHVFWVGGSPIYPSWQFNGDLDKPTFSPSLLNTCDNHPDPAQRRCHLNLIDGKLHYHNDCTHPLAGKTMDLEERKKDEGAPP